MAVALLQSIEVNLSLFNSFMTEAVMTGFYMITTSDMKGLMRYGLEAF